MKQVKNYMISVRLPSSLVEEVKDVSKKDHYLDLSEAVRSIIRNNWLKNKDPISFQLRRMRKEINATINQKNQEQLLNELKRIMDSVMANDNVPKDNEDNEK